MKYRSALAVLLLGLSFPVSAAPRDDTKPSFEIYGFAHLDYIQDFDRVNPAWDATLRPSRIPTTPGQFGQDGKATLSARQSRLGAQGSIPTETGAVFGRFEFDLYGVGVDEGQTTIRLRHAYGTWREVLAGQTNSLFMDGDVFPNVLDYWGPSGMVFLRNPQIRWTPLSGREGAGGKNTLAVAIEQPFTDVDAGLIRNLDPNLGANIQTKSSLPDLTAQFRHEGGWGHVQLGSILRRLGYETLGTPENKPSGYNLGWGVDLTGSVKTRGKSKFDIGAVFGEGISNYMNDGGMDLAPEATGSGLRSTAVPLWGILAYYNHWWSDKWSSTGGYSRTQVENTNFQQGTAFHSGEYASANLVYYPNKEFFMGAEFLWGQRTDNSGAKGIDRRLQISAHYNFSTNALFAKLNP